MKKDKVMVYLSYAVVYIVWGSTYFFIKIAVETIPPLVLVCCRWSLGGLLFLAYYYVKHGFKAPLKREIISSFLMGILLIFIPNSVVSAVERNMDSYLTALILATAPMGVVFFDRFLLGKRIPVTTLVGIITGITGVGILVYDGGTVRSGFAKEVIMLISVVIAFSLGTSIGHRINAETSIVLNTGYQMMFSGLVSFVWLAYSSLAGLAEFGSFSTRSLFAMAYLATIGSVAFGAYNYLIKHEPATRVTSYAIVNPVIAVFLGLVIGRESPARYIAFGIPVALAGLALMLYGESLFAYVKEKALVRLRSHRICGVPPEADL